MLHPEFYERFRLTGARSEPGSPQESFGLLLAERSVVLGHNAHSLLRIKGHAFENRQANVRAM
jgi:hypothetical protein